VTPSINPNTQAEWRNRALTAAGYDPRRDYTNESFRQWWFNSINPASLRLSKPGVTWFLQQSKFKFVGVELSIGIRGKHLLQLERLLDEPYYIRTYKNIMVMSEVTAVMLALHAGDLGQYLDNLQANQ
jgi:hypothetical protein